MTRFERPRYFAGELVTADDLEMEQRYHIEKRWLLNRMFQGTGVVSGLEVGAGEKGTVTIAPGFAVDECGREIVVCEPLQLAIPDTVEPVSVCLLDAEEETDRGTIRETYELTASTAAPEQAVVLGAVKRGVIGADDA